jgi:CheY-like chemotaxis protein
MINTIEPVTIVLVEDDEGHARLIEKNLKRAGVFNDIHHFANGMAAMEYLFQSNTKSAHPLLVLLDLNLPDMSGLDILTRLKQDPVMRQVPVIVLTTTDDQREIQHCYALGCNVYITKPVHYEAFSQAIRQLGLFLSVIQVPDQE